MRIAKLKIFLLFYTIISIVSCSKDDSNTPTNVETEKWVISAKHNDGSRYEYSYHKNLLTKVTNIKQDGSIEESMVIYNANNTINKYGNNNYEYDNNGILIGYNQYSIEGYKGPSMSSRVSVYDKNSSYGDPVMHLRLNNLGRVVYKEVPNDHYINYFYDESGNIIKEEYWHRQDILLNTIYYEYSETQNPFYGQLESIYIQRFIRMNSPVVFLNGYEFPYQKKNIRKVTYFSEINGEPEYYEHIDYSYTYNSDSDPISIEAVYSNNSNPFKLDLEYNK
ncbi:hypothetical protein [uncultured Algibacter sp.]|uniref:hypothetical protein n=1 Tax=uncultured Algibacter sp. TaxID=298659 RepID=UPI002629D296|nr:hypothetical protein [uncultured Algibacter sp.]